MTRRKSTYGISASFIAGLLVAGLLSPLLFASTETVQTTQTSDDGLETATGSSDDGDETAVGPVTGETQHGAGGGDPGADGSSGSSAGPASSDSGPSGASSSGDGSNGAPARGAASGGDAPTASDVGVTEKTIKVGVPVFDLGALAAYGVEAESDGLEEQMLMFNAIVDDYNAKGGVHGRKIELAFAQFNPLDMDDMRAACQKMAEDDKVFSVMAQAFWGPAILCLTERFEIPLIVDDGTSDEYYRRSNGLLFSTQQGKARAIRNQIWMLHEMGLLKGKKIGALVSEISGDADAPDESLKQTLAQFGYTLTHEARITSIEAMPSEIPIHVQQMKAKGVDFVIATQTSALWNDEAERQNFRPRYSVSDFSQKTRDSAVDDHGKHWDKTIGISGTLWADNGGNVPETPATRHCIDRATANGSGPYERGEFTYDVQIGACNVVDTFMKGASAAGVNLTRRGLSQSIQHLGTVDLANMNAAGFRPGKFDLPETVRPIEWRIECTCYVPIGPFRPAKF